MIQAPHQTPLPAIAKDLPPADLAAARQTAQEFESVFLNTMLSQMFSGLGKETPFGGGSQAEDTYRSMLTETYADEMSASGGIGLADHVLRDIIALQETNR